MKFTESQIAEFKVKIIDFIQLDGLSLRRVCSKVDMPGTTVVLEWLKKDSEFTVQYVRAGEIRADKIADEILDICDATSNDIVLDQETGAEVVNHNVINRDKLRIDTRKWLLGKLQPKKYGDKLDVTTNGENVNTNLVQFYIPENNRDVKTDEKEVKKAKNTKIVKQ